MDGALILVVDYEDVCRLCLRARGALSDLFPQAEEPDEDGGGAPTLAEQIRAVTAVSMSATDGLPTKICHRCRYLVETCYELRATVIASNRLLTGTEETERLLDEVGRSLKDDRREPEFADADEDATTRLDDAIEYFKDEEIAETVDVKLEAVDGEGEGEPFDAYQRHYVSSKDVTFDEIELGDASLSQVQLAPEASDDAGSDGLNPKQKDGSVDRPPRQQSCQLCLQVFADRNAMIAHIVDHYKNSNLVPYISATKPFVCQECNINFTIKMDLIIHHREHLDINPYMCKVPGCNHDIRSREALRHHMFTHALKKYVCNQCGARYRRKVEIMRHKIRHLDEGRQFRCGLCYVICKNRLSLKAHLKNHENGRRFKCDFPGCLKAFFSNSDLTVHSRSHSNDKCFKCTLCVSAYTSQSQLNRHLRRHNKPGPTKCDKCSEIFDDYGSFCNHRISTHGLWQPHRCKGCNQGYQSEAQLERHLSRCDVVQKMKELGEDINMIIEDKHGIFMDNSNNFQINK